MRRQVVDEHTGRMVSPPTAQLTDDDWQPASILYKIAIMNKIDLTETMKMSPRRVFKCGPCNMISPRNKVKKNRKGEYFCPECGMKVTDITDTVTGHDFMEIVHI